MLAARRWPRWPSAVGAVGSIWMRLCLRASTNRPTLEKLSPCAACAERLSVVGVLSTNEEFVMNVDDVSRILIPSLMRIEFEGAPWSWIVDPDGGGTAPWLAPGAVAEFFGPTDVFPDASIRVIVRCNDPSEDGLWPQLHIKCGVLKGIPDDPRLPAAVNSFNIKTIFGRLQLHTSASEGDRALTCDHFMALKRLDIGDPSARQAALDTLGMVRNMCAGKAASELGPTFGGRPFAGENDGPAVAMAG